MLKSYPIEATRENWLHEAIVQLIKDISQRIDQAENIVNNQATWVYLLNQLEGDLQQILSPLTGIRDRLFEYKDELLNYTAAERQYILIVIDSQNAIANLLNGTEPVQIIKESYPKLHKKAKNLFVFCYEKLSDLGIRSRQYNIIFSSLEDKICPFCGIERVMHPNETAQDQDHYLAKSIYPFSAVNMRNLVPMCRCCNRDYKKDIDLIISGCVRRKAFDPYNCNPPTITLEQSTVILNSSPIGFEWNIRFLSDIEESETWNEVFSIRTRYKRDVLNEYFDKWLRGFSDKFRKARRRNELAADLTHQQIRQHLSFYQEDKADFPSIGLGGFLEPLVFAFLLFKYDQGDQRIINLIRDAVLGITAESLVA